MTLAMMRKVGVDTTGLDSAACLAGDQDQLCEVLARGLVRRYQRRLARLSNDTYEMPGLPVGAVSLVALHPLRASSFASFSAHADSRTRCVSCFCWQVLNWTNLLLKNGGSSVELLSWSDRRLCRSETWFAIAEGLEPEQKLAK